MTVISSTDTMEGITSPQQPIQGVDRTGGLAFDQNWLPTNGFLPKFPCSTGQLSFETAALL